MKRAIPAFLVLLALPVAAHGADKSPPAPGLDPARIDWNGFHAGPRMAYISADTNGVSDDGVAGGVTLGYDWQVGPTVAGLAGGVAITDIDLAPHVELDSIIDLRARFGLSFDRVLVFGTGGGAYASGNGLGDSGWTAGAGVNFRPRENLIWGMQYLKYKFENLNHTKSSLEIDLIEGELTYKF